MTCLHCGKKLGIGLLRKKSNSPFCSEEHRLKFMAEQEQIALARLIDAQVAKRPERLDLFAPPPVTAAPPPEEAPPPAVCGFLWPAPERVDSPPQLAKAGFQPPRSSAGLLPRIEAGLRHLRLHSAPTIRLQLEPRYVTSNPNRPNPGAVTLPAQSVCPALSGTLSEATLPMSGALALPLGEEKRRSGFVAVVSPCTLRNQVVPRVPSPREPSSCGTWLAPVAELRGPEPASVPFKAVNVPASPETLNVEVRVAAFIESHRLLGVSVAFPLPLSFDVEAHRFAATPVKIGIPVAVPPIPWKPRKVRAGLRPRRPLVRLDEDPPLAGSINIGKQLLASGDQTPRSVTPQQVDQTGFRFPHVFPVAVAVPAAHLVSTSDFPATTVPVITAAIQARLLTPNWPLRKQEHRVTRPHLTPGLGRLAGLDLYGLPGSTKPRQGSVQPVASGPPFRSPRVWFDSRAFGPGIASTVPGVGLTVSTSGCAAAPIVPFALPQTVPLSFRLAIQRAPLPEPRRDPPAFVVLEPAVKVFRSLPIRPLPAPFSVPPISTGPGLRSQSIASALGIPLIWPVRTVACPHANALPIAAAPAHQPPPAVRRPQTHCRGNAWRPEQPDIFKPLPSLSPKGIARQGISIPPRAHAVQTNLQLTPRQVQLGLPSAIVSKPAGTVAARSLGFKPVGGPLTPVWISIAIPLVVEARRNVKGPAIRSYAAEDEAPSGLMNTALARWRSLPALPKWSGVVMFLALAGFAGIPRPNGSASANDGSGFDAMLARRAAVELRDEFREGLAHWEGEGDWSRTWKLDAAGFLQPGPIAAYRPSRRLEDYEFEFLGQIIHKSMGWAVRAGDLRNYQAVKLSVVGGGAVPEVALIRYPVVQGKPGKVTQRRVPMDLRLDTVYRISTRVTGNDFTVTIQGQVVDYWNEPALAKGGVGLFTAKGEQARIRWIEVRNQTDMIGKLCALLAPAPTEVKR